MGCVCMYSLICSLSNEGSTALTSVQYPKPDIPNPGLDPDQPVFNGKMKGRPNPQTGYSFIQCDEVSMLYPGRDVYPAFLRFTRDLLARVLRVELSILRVGRFWSMRRYFGRPVRGCIQAELCKKIMFSQLFYRSTRHAHFSAFGILLHREKRYDYHFRQLICDNCSTYNENELNV